MERDIIYLVSILTLAVFPNVVYTAIWNPLDYMVTVEKPVTLVTYNEVLRQNGVCCSPNNHSQCITCPDDPTVDFRVFICFRRGYVKGQYTDDNYCPLGGVEVPPNSAPGPWLHLTPRIEAENLPREYPGALQLKAKITGHRNGEEIHLDDVFVYGQNIIAGNGFRRITYLSTKSIAVVGVNVRVECTSNNCSAATPTTPTRCPDTTETTLSSSTMETTSPASTVETTSLALNTSTNKSQYKKATMTAPRCVGFGLVAGMLLTCLLTVVIGVITYYKYKKNNNKIEDNRSTDSQFSANSSLLADGEENHPLYEEIECVNLV